MVRLDYQDDGDGDEEQTVGVCAALVCGRERTWRLIRYFVFCAARQRVGDLN